MFTRTPVEFEGLEIRTMTSDIAADTYKVYGATLTPTPFPRFIATSSCDLRRIDVQANPVFAIEEMGFYEVQDIMTFVRRAQFVTSVISNKA